MSQTVTRELMIFVERIVRPLPMPLSRRMRVRKELLAHLETTYAEELARDGDQQAALVRMRERFGDPQKLSEELRAAVSPWDSWLARHQSLFTQQPGASTAWYAVRIAASAGLMMAFLFSIAIMLRHLCGKPIFEAEMRLFCGLVVCLTIWTAGFIYFGLRAGAAWDQSPRNWPSIVTNALGLLAASPFAWALLMSFVTGSLASDWRSLAGMLFAGVLTLLVGVAVGILHHREQAGYLPWAELSLDTV
jgi:hypothetical protein